MESRIEKKFTFQPGDKKKISLLLIEGLFSRLYENRKVNSIYYDTSDLNSLWDNINGYSKRCKFRVRWYNEIKNSEVFFEIKKKINQITYKKKFSLGNFKNLESLNNYLESKVFDNKLNNFTFLNLKRVLNVSYQRDYYTDNKKKLRITVDEHIKTFNNCNLKGLNNSVNLAHNVLEFKYSNTESSYIRDKIKNLKFNLRNQKFSKYVQSFMLLNEMGYH